MTVPIIMSYLVLARKYRPQSFEDLLGQEHIAQILQKAIKSERIGHAFLFCGPRGVGKTSCARILAKSLNCEKGPTLKPCGECSACKEIASSTSFDVLEIDGASNRGIDEIRTLRENVKFAPSYGRYKVYIVDEVHMLTTEAFNALLKTLEEPPEHVKFIFATTNPQKVPSTILSRCQRFDFKRVNLKTIVSLLEGIAKKESIKIDEQALYAIAKASGGSLRDGLSIFDQLSALGSQTIKLADVSTMLGIVETELLFDISRAIVEDNCTAGLEAIDKIIDEGKDPKALLRDLVEHFRNLMIIKIGGTALSRLVDYPAAIKDMYLEQSNNIGIKKILRSIDLLLEAADAARITESSRMPLEIALAKLTQDGEVSSASSNAPKAQSPVKAPPSKAPSRPQEPPARAYNPAQVLRNNKGQVDIAGNEPSPPPPPRREEPESTADDDEVYIIPEEVDLDLVKIKAQWDALTYTVSKEKMSIATFLQEGTPIKFKDNTLTVGFPVDCKFHMETLSEPSNARLVETAFADKLTRTIKVKYELAESMAPKDEEPVVQSVLDQFKGKVVERWHDE